MKYFKDSQCTIASSDEEVPRWKELGLQEITKAEYDAIMNKPAVVSDEERVSAAAGKILLALAQEVNAANLLTALKAKIQSTLEEGKDG